MEDETILTIVYIIDVCDAKPCKNEGTCSFDADGVYLCNCKPGYTGNDCEESK